jgi:hypothetical protein
VWGNPCDPLLLIGIHKSGSWCHNQRQHMRNDFLQRIYRLKVTIVALVSIGVGIGLQVLAGYATRTPSAAWLTFWPIAEIGGTLFAAGLFGIVWDYFDGKDKDQRDDARIRRLLEESAPAFRDAVVQGFAVESDDLKRIATPELLDDIATNALSLRLGDRTFASEVYADVRDQAIRAPERWHDVNASIRLSPAGETSATGGGAQRSFIVTVKWEFTVIPTHAVQHFACVSDRDEYHELISETPATIAWFMTPRPGFNASERSAFELLQFSVDGDEKSIRRSSRKTGQTYSAAIGEDAVRNGKPVRISYLYRTITPQSGHLLYFDIEQPTRNISVDFDYSETDISHVSVLDLVASSKKTRVEHLPATVPGKSVSVDFDGWAFPRTGFAFVWTLHTEDHTSPKGDPIEELLQARARGSLR